MEPFLYCLSSRMRANERRARTKARSLFSSMSGSASKEWQKITGNLQCATGWWKAQKSLIGKNRSDESLYNDFSLEIVSLAPFCVQINQSFDDSSRSESWKFDVFEAKSKTIRQTRIFSDLEMLSVAWIIDRCWCKKYQKESCLD